MAQTNNNNGNNNINKEEEEIKVVLEQTLLRTEEIFVYQIPPMMNAGGHQ
jgi:hypothetical protein